MKFSALFYGCLHLFAASACLLPSERPGHPDYNKPGRVHRRQGPIDNSTNTGMPISETNRFPCNGSNVPRGVGSVDEPANITHIMSMAEVRSAVKALEARFSDVHFFELPYKTYENRTLFAARIGGRGGDPSSPAGYNVLVQASVHPRERGSPDHLLYMVADLLWAREEGRGLRYGGNKYSAADVAAALDVGLVIIPVVNPDGMAWDQQTHSCWRKNRNLDSATSSDPYSLSVGVDLNRNFDVLWDYNKYLAPNTWAASNESSNQAFYGTGPFSEPEARNVRWVLDQHPDLGWYMDLHTASQVVVHGWCHDTVQADDPTQNYRNPAYDGLRGTVNDPTVDYAEYMDRADWDTLSVASARMASAMQQGKSDDWAWNSTPYVATQGLLGFGPSTGCAIDHAYTRHLEDPSKKKILGFGFEFGLFNDDAECFFYPTERLFNENNRSVAAGLMELLLIASRAM